MNDPLVIELTDAEREQLRALEWRRHNPELMAQIIVRDYLLRERLRDDRKRRERERR